LVVGGPEGYDCAAERFTVFTDTFAEAGFPVPEQACFPGDYSGESGRVAVTSAVADGIEFDAVFAHNDLSAAGVLQMLAKAGRPVPEDVAVIGFDDAGHAALGAPPLTAVHRPLREIGAEAAHMLASALAGREVPDEPVEIATDLVVRDSTVRPD
jgi:LacI family transcriptional regulator